MWVRPEMVLAPGDATTPWDFPDNGISITVGGFNDVFPSYLPMLQFGGADLQTAWGGFDCNLSATQSITGVGFQPTLVMIFGIHISGFSDGCIAPTWGCATGSGATEQWAYGATQDYGGASHTSTPRSGIYDGAIIWSNAPVKGDGFRPTSDARATLTSMDSDGFSLAWTYGTMGSTPSYYWVAMRHPTQRFAAGIETQKTSNGTKSNTSVGWQPQTMLFMSAGNTTLKTLSNNHNIVTGMAGGSPIANKCLYQQMPYIVGGGSGGENYRYYGDTLCLQQGSGGATLGEATCAMTATGFDLTWANVDGAAKQIGYLAFEGGDDWSGDTPTAYMFFGVSGTNALNTFEADSAGHRTSFFYGGQIGFGAGNSFYVGHWERAADALLAQNYETSSGTKAVGHMGYVVTGLFYWSGYVVSASPLPGGMQQIYRRL